MRGIEVSVMNRVHDKYVEQTCPWISISDSADRTDPKCAITRIHVEDSYKIHVDTRK
jgi:hypothetical protein